MRAPQYIVKNPEVSKFSKYAMNLHLNKLQVIKERKSKKLSNTPSPISKYSRAYDERNYELGKKNEIDRENRALYNRLLYISNSSSVVLDRMKKAKRQSFKSSYQIHRENQEKKIASENAQLIKKLTEARPAVVKKALDEEYNEYIKRKKMLLKINANEDIKPVEGIRSSIAKA